MAGVPHKRVLLREIESVTHSDRARRLAELGRDNAGTPALRALLDDLDADLYEWQLRLVAATAARQSDDVVAGLRHPLRSVRSIAIASLRTVSVDPAVIVDLVLNGRVSDAGALLASIRAGGDQELAERLLPDVFDRFGARQAAALLPACSATTVSFWLPAVEHGVTRWARLATSHPEEFLHHVEVEMAAAPLLADIWWERAGDGIAALVSSRPDAVLDLWERHAAERGVPNCLSNTLHRLVVADADRTLHLLLRPAARPGLGRHLRSLRRHLHHATDDMLGLVAKAVVSESNALLVVLANVAPSRRASIYQRAVEGLDPVSLRVPKPILDALPRAVRTTEVRRLIQMADRAQDPATRQELLCSLPIEESWSELLAGTDIGDPLVRAQAYRRLVSAVLDSRNPLYVDRLLDELQRLANEQDPVRQAALAALAPAPAWLFGPAHMERLVSLVTFVAEARDTSHATSSALVTLFGRLLASAVTPSRQFLVEPCVEALATLVGRGGFASFGRLEDQLPSGGEQVLFDALAPHLDSDVRAGRFAMLFGFAGSLGRRAQRVDGLQALLYQATKTANTNSARRAIDLWLAPKSTRGLRLGQLATDDPSVLLLDTPFAIAAVARQDLLPAVLGRKAPSGRFAVRERRLVPLVRRGSRRWTPAQRERYADLLADAITSEHTGHRRLQATQTLARVPEAGEPWLRTMLSHEDVLVVEAALGGLVWGERPEEVLGLLLGHADGDRARVAVSATSRAARFAAPGSFAVLARSLLEGWDAKITSRKEVLRILGRDRSAGAVEVFQWLWTQRPLHRDITVALGSALRNYPYLDLTWDVLAEMASGSDTEALAVLGLAQPMTWPADLRGRLADLVIPLVEHPNRLVANTAWIGLVRWRPWSDEVGDLLCDAIADLSRRADFHPAAYQLRLLVDGFPSDMIMEATVAALLAAPSPTDSEAGAERDLPFAQRLRRLSQQQPQWPEGRAGMLRAAEVIVDADLAPEALGFVTGAIDWADPNQPDETLHVLFELAEADPFCLPRLGPVITEALLSKRNEGRWEPADLLDSAATFTAHPGDAAGLIALAVVSAAGPRSGWAPAWRDLLRQLRRRSSPWVATPAANLMTAPE